MARHHSRNAFVMLLIIAFLSIGSVANLGAHSGGTDSKGGHIDHKHGGYHFHRGPLAGQSFGSKSEAYTALAKVESGSASPKATPTPQDITLKSEQEALVNLLVKKGIITRSELAEELSRVRQ